MKKILILLLLIFIGYKYTNESNVSSELPSKEEHNPVIENSNAFQTLSKANKTSKYKCDGREHCSQMKTYEEAKFFLDNCPNTKMDGDHDGIPCERQFRK